MSETSDYRVFYYHNLEDHDWTFTFNQVWYGPNGELRRVKTQSVGPIGEFAKELGDEIAEMKRELGRNDGSLSSLEAEVDAKAAEISKMERALELPHLDWTRLHKDVELV